MKEHFLLRPEIAFLNFGSFGACPRSVFEEYRKWQLQLEHEPVQFMLHQGPAQLKISKQALADFVGCNANDIVFTTNPSYAINIVAKNLKLAQGEEILTTDLEYGAMDRTWAHHASMNGYVYKRQPIRLPLVSEDDFCEQFWQGLTSKTKAVFLSQITSSTALIFPVEKICRRAKELGLLTIVDGAHVPGHIPIDISTLHADIYTGACHKWMFAPKGCSFLYASPEVQEWLDPLVVSWGFGNPEFTQSKFQDYHQQQGTRDYAAFLTIPACLEFIKNHDIHHKAMECRNMVMQQTIRFSELLHTPPLAPLTEKFFGQMCSLQITTDRPEGVKQKLYDHYQIEIPIMQHAEKVYIRFSIQVFNTLHDMDRLHVALSEMRHEGWIH